MRPTADVIHLLTLDVHAADEHDLGPGEIVLGCRPDVLIDEANLPLLGQIGRNQQQTLRRHEGLHAVGQRIGVFERTKRRSITRKYAENTTYRLDAIKSHRSSLATSCTTPA